MNDFFTGRSAIVTGAAQGIGLAIAELLAARGVRLLLLDVKASGNAAAGTLPGATFLTCDIASDDAVRDAAAVARERLGEVDFLINNAGIYPRIGTLEMAETDWQRVLNTNLGGAFRLVKHVVPLMPRGRGAAIVNVSSGTAFEGAADGPGYSASKAGLLGLTRSWAREFADRGIRVNTLVPGITDTAQPRQVLSTEQLHEIGARIPLGRIAEPVDIARGAIFLCSEEAGYMTGQSLVVNGGRVML